VLSNKVLTHNGQTGQFFQTYKLVEGSGAVTSGENFLSGREADPRLRTKMVEHLSDDRACAACPGAAHELPYPQGVSAASKAARKGTKHNLPQPTAVILAH